MLQAAAYDQVNQGLHPVVVRNRRTLARGINRVVRSYLFWLFLGSTIHRR